MKGPRNVGYEVCCYGPEWVFVKFPGGRWHWQKFALPLGRGAYRSVQYLRSGDKAFRVARGLRQRGAKDVFVCVITKMKDGRCVYTAEYAWPA